MKPSVSNVRNLLGLVEQISIPHDLAFLYAFISFPICLSNYPRIGG